MTTYAISANMPSLPDSLRQEMAAGVTSLACNVLGMLFTLAPVIAPETASAPAGGGASAADGGASKRPAPFALPADGQRGQKMLRRQRREAAAAAAAGAEAEVSAALKTA